MLTSNTMRYGADTFGENNAPFSRRALLVSNVALDCSNKSAVNKINVNGSQPDNTSRKFIFKIDGALKYFSGSSLVDFPHSDSIDDVLTYGNNPATLRAQENISAFVDKKIYPIIALEALSNAEEMPSAKISLETQTSTDNLTKTTESPVYPFDDEVTIIDISAQVSGDVTVTVRIKDADDNWSSYMTLANAANKQACAVQFKFVYKVSAIGNSSIVDKIVVKYAQATNQLSGDRADIYSVVCDYEVPLQNAYVVVRHDPLQDATINAYVNFMTKPARREVLRLGVADGSRQDFILGDAGVADENIIASTLQVYVNDTLATNFSFNSEVSTITLSARQGAVISATYDYNHDSETWHKMTLESTQPYNDDAGTYISRYSFKLPDDDADNKVISNVRLELVKESGTFDNLSLGKGAGKLQLRTLPHKPIVSTLSFSENVDWSFDEASGIMKVVAAKNTPMILSGSWQGVAPVIHSFTAGWSLA